MARHNPEYDGRTVFKAEIGKLASGDILLTRNAEGVGAKDKAQSSMIAWASGGAFSHALICTEPPTFIEANGDHVSTLSIQNCFAHDLKNVRLLRYPDPTIASHAGSIATSALGQGYSLRAAIASIWTEGESIERVDDGTFCSALVGAAYRVAGSPEFQAIRPERITPATLERMSGFRNITSEVFHPILAPQNIEQMTALDGERMRSPVIDQSSLLNEFYRSIRPDLDNCLVFYPSYPKPKTFFDCLNFIVRAIENCDAAIAQKTTSDLRTHLEQLEQVDAKAGRLLADGRFDGILRAAAQIDAATCDRAIRESFNPKPDLNLEDLENLLTATNNQISSRTNSLTSYKPTSLGRIRALSEWHRINQAAIDEFKARKLALEEVLSRLKARNF